MERIDLKLNEDYRVNWQITENGLPGVLPIITALCDKYNGLSFVFEGSHYTRRSDEPDNNKFTYQYKLLSYPESKKRDEDYRLTEEDKSHILQLMFNYIKEYEKYGRYHNIWAK